MEQTVRSGGCLVMIPVNARQQAWVRPGDGVLIRIVQNVVECCLCFGSLYDWESIHSERSSGAAQSERTATVCWKGFLDPKRSKTANR